MTAMAHSADAWRAGTRRLGHDGPVPGTGADRSSAVLSGARTVRSWPLLVLAAPAAAEVWSGWVGIAQKTGFGLVSPLPGIWPSLHLDTTITLPVGVEAYAAYALRAWLAREDWISGRTRRFARWSAICSFVILSFRVSRGCDLRRLAEDTVLGEACEALSCLFSGVDRYRIGAVLTAGRRGPGRVAAANGCFPRRAACCGRGRR